MIGKKESVKRALPTLKNMNNREGITGTLTLRKHESYHFHEVAP